MLGVAIDRGPRIASKWSLPCPNYTRWLEARDGLYEEIMHKPDSAVFGYAILKSPENGGLCSNNLIYRYDTSKSSDGVEEKRKHSACARFDLVRATSSNTSDDRCSHDMTPVKSSVFQEYTIPNYIADSGIIPFSWDLEDSYMDGNPYEPPSFLAASRQFLSLR
ncbi:hypothetical protein C8J56DRAFT_481989 [Mycena floridula]|nr:hypothetical protein C8J56DRAFT_481989 [Mycena floridula]